MKNHYLISLLIITAFYFNHAAKSHAQEQKSSMMVFSEVAGAQEILAGNYSEAIRQMQLAKSNNPMLLFNNLCVAYALSDQFKQARNHCARAVKETYRNENYGATWLEQTRPHRVKRLYRARAREHLRILDSIESLDRTTVSSSKPQND